jgi:hypothetical protein
MNPLTAAVFEPSETFVHRRTMEANKQILLRSKWIFQDVLKIFKK